MGNKEDLMAGALRCLKERGWARTTVRDIAAAAGVSHAAIGYHFGSREALLVAAYVRAMEEWGEEVGRATAASIDPSATAAEQYAAYWSEMIKSFDVQRQLWTASMEAFVLAEHDEQMRELLAAALKEGRSGVAALLSGIPEPDLDTGTLRTLGGVQMALTAGVMLQWLATPAEAPTGPEVIAGLRALVTRMDQ